MAASNTMVKEDMRPAEAQSMCPSTGFTTSALLNTVVAAGALARRLAGPLPARRAGRRLRQVRLMGPISLMWLIPQVR